MIHKIALSSVLIAGTASTAFAGGLAEAVVVAAPVVVTAAPVVMSNDWTGFYVGGSFGKGEVDDGVSDELDADNYGVHAGYLRDYGSIVVGGELEYSRLDVDTINDADVLRLKGRVGYDAGAFLPYLTAGAAQLSLKDADLDDTGYFYGIGADYAFNDNFRVGAEVLQHEFEDFNDSGFDVSAQTLALRVSYSF
ncbi:outer membrane protein [Yoonia sp. MH D7]